MVCACVDIGTNTTRVLVADVKDGSLTEVLQRRAFTRIGTRAEIPHEKIEEVSRVVAEQVALAATAGAERVRVVATACIRAAVNRDEFLAGMSEQVEILDGDEEARLAFLGATHTLGHDLPGVVGVVDVGGGSTEIAVGTVAGGVTWSSSFLVGSGALADRYLRSDPPSLDELRAVREHALRRVRRARPSRTPTARWRSAAAPPRCAASWATCSTATRCAGRSARCRARPPPRWPSSSRSTPAACGCCRPAS